MKFVIFAGGVGTRLWPLSRKKSPKQFEKVLGEKSTLQSTVERILPLSSWNEIFVSTGKRYTELVAKNLPLLPQNHIIGEPEMRDVGPAVGLMTAILSKKDPDEPMAILWSDHLVKNESIFQKSLETAENLVKEKKANIVFITQKARFPSQNLGWIEYGKPVFKNDNGITAYTFKGLTYRPTLEKADAFFKTGHHAWNVGYFVTTPAFLWKKYKQLTPQLFEQLEKLQSHIGNENFEEQLGQVYPTIDKISFDEAILTRIADSEALVLSEELGWSDIGAWEALKEALQTSPNQNVIQGKVLLEDASDSLIYNYGDQLIVGIDLKGLLVVNTKDVILICHKDSVPKIKKIVEQLSGTENDHLT